MAQLYADFAWKSQQIVRVIREHEKHMKVLLERWEIAHSDDLFFFLLAIQFWVRMRFLEEVV